MSLRAPLALARGLGSAKSGLQHWWLQRLTAVALVPLCLWLVVAVIRVSAMSYDEATAWIGHPVNATLLIAFIVAAFWHALLGVQVVIEDYVHGEWARLASLVLLRVGMALLGLVSVVAVLRIAIGAA